MKVQLISPACKAYKANLHSHSTFSDGKLTPEQIKEAYMARGYQIVAFSDHEYLIDHSDLSDENFLALTSYEMQIMDMSVPTKAHRKATHLNLLAKKPHNVSQIFFNPKYFSFGSVPFGKQELIPSLKYIGSNEAERYHTIDCINDIIQQARDAGFIVCYNHPAWSLVDAGDYTLLRGLFAMEIYNGGCAKLGFTEYSTQAYDEMLRSGQRIGCVATDDNHNNLPFDNPASDSFCGFTMVYAKDLSYDSVIEALECGNYYASTGPTFDEIFYDETGLHVRFSPCTAIKLLTYGRRTEAKWCKGGDTMTEADFLIKDTDVYFRLEIIDKFAHRAFSRAYFLNEIPCHPCSSWYNK